MLKLLKNEEEGERSVRGKNEYECEVEDEYRDKLRLKMKIK